MKKTFALFIAAMAICVASQSFVAFAQVGSPGAPAPAGTATLQGNQASGSGNCGGDPLSNLFCSGSLPQMLNFAFQAAIRLGAVLAMLRIAYAGYLYMGSEDMWSTKSHAKEVFRDAIIGLLVLLAVYLILHQIDPRILNLQVKGLNDAPSTPTTPLPFGGT
jgi:threonine/homoserine/homoserine lactone efflux protein